MYLKKYIQLLRTVEISVKLHLQHLADTLLELLKSLTVETQERV